MKNKLFVKAGTFLLATTLCVSMTACGKKDQLPPSDVDPNVSVSENEAENEAENPFLEKNMEFIKDICSSTDETITDALNTLHEAGFQEIVEVKETVDSNDDFKNYKIKDNEKTIYFITVDSASKEMTKIFDEDGSTIWMTTVAGIVSVEGDVNVTVEDKTGETIETTENSTVSENDTDNKVNKADYCDIESISETEYKITSSGELGDDTKVVNTTMGDYVDVLDDILKENGYSKINRNIYYDVMATSFFTRIGIEAELSKPKYSFAIAYLSQMFTDKDEFKYTEFIDDKDNGYYEFIYHINNSKISIDSNGKVTYDGKDVDLSEQIRIFTENSSTDEQSSDNESSNSDKDDNSDAFNSDPTGKLHSIQILDAANITFVNYFNLSKDMVDYIIPYAGNIASVSKGSDGWEVSTVSGKILLIKTMIENDAVTITIEDPSEEYILYTYHDKM